MAIKRWEILSEEEVHSKYGRSVVKRMYKLPDGQEADYYVKKEKNTVCVFALTDDEHVILVEQYRPGPDEVMLDLPGGFIDNAGDEALQIAQNELLEETGYSGTFACVATVIDDAYSTVKRTVFAATGCKKVAQQRLEATEFAEVKLLDLAAFRRLLQSGRLTDIEAGYLALDYLNLLGK